VWLLPFFPRLSSFSVRLFYRLRVAGGRVPATGPVLLVANHPNSLVDPGAVAAVARRPVRFLAKSTLLDDPRIGWLVRGAGAIPVYRQVDDPAATPRNEDAFRAVHAALERNAAVGIFPEGTSHSEPSLGQVRTGAARMALGAAERIGGPFPVIPVGLSFRAKETFRSDALVMVGEPVPWADLAGAGVGDVEAVRALTARIADALGAVTVNLERWEDAPLVETAEAVFAAERGLDRAPAARLVRQRETARMLAELRAEDRAGWRDLAREVAGHARVLRILGMRPREVISAPRPRVAAGWVARQAAFFALAVPVAAVGIAVYWVPYALTGTLEARLRPAHDTRATHKLLGGGVLHLLWTAAIAAAGWRWVGAGAGIAAAAGLPAAGVVAVHVLDRWERAVAEGRRFFLRSRRRAELAEVRARQAELAGRLDALRRALRP
jgi:glycerol-3-phosphate O-acyltransferase / dihydroxyacetone phosphate acyltransferase